MRLLTIFSGIAIAIAGQVRSGCADDAPSDARGAPRKPVVLQPAAGDDAPVVSLDADGPETTAGLYEIGDFSLIDQTGETVTKDDLLGTQWVASFIFTRCAGACPQLVKSIYDLNQSVADVDVRFVTITVDPEFDTVERMAQYAGIYEAEPPRWLFLTGEYDEVYRLIRDGFKVAASENFGADRLPGFEFAHSLRLIHVGPDGEVLGLYDSRENQELLVLEQVLKGNRETPPGHRPVPPDASIDATPADETEIDETSRAPAEPPLPEPQQADVDRLPPWAQRLPTTNAMLNTLATLLLLAGFAAIRAGRVTLHRRMMLFCFGVSVAFLCCYLAYHLALDHYTGTHGKSFEGPGILRPIYYCVLISHVALAALVPFLATVTIYRGLTAQWVKHRRIARITFPIWLYVSVTGVIIYLMLYKL